MLYVYITDTESAFVIGDDYNVVENILGKKNVESVSADLNNDKRIDSYDMIIIRQHFSSYLEKNNLE